MAHTPGPWFVDKETLTVRSKIWESDQMADYRGCIMADLKPALGAVDGADLSIVRPFAQAETNANALLIASAPELLEALNDLMRAIDYGDGVTAAYDNAERAIAKAKGE